MTDAPRFGVMLPMWDYHVYDDVSFEQLAAMAREAERLGYDYVSVDDHVQRGEGGRVFESLTTLSALAALTSRVRLLTTVLCAMYRPPSLVAKIASTIDTISKGRLELGIGAGWKQEEAAAYGLPWDDAKGRLDRLEETCQIILGMWTQDTFTFDGRYFRLHDATCDPRPVQAPHPPLWIGGGGEKRTLRIAARFADGVNFAGPGIGRGGPSDPIEHFVHKREVLYAHCAKVGRDPRRIALSSGVNIMLWGRSVDAVEARFSREAAQTGMSEPERQRLSSSLRSSIKTPAEAIDRIGRYLEAGASYVTVGRPTVEGLQQFAGEVMPHFRGSERGMPS
jgi:F420-dependent oxidoreductase-like protein